MHKTIESICRTLSNTTQRKAMAAELAEALKEFLGYRNGCVLYLLFFVTFTGRLPTASPISQGASQAGER